MPFSIEFRRISNVLKADLLILIRTNEEWGIGGTLIFLVYPQTWRWRDFRAGSQAACPEVTLFSSADHCELGRGQAGVCAERREGGTRLDAVD